MRIVLISILLWPVLYGATRYVDSQASGANNGTSWNDAWTALPTSGISAGDTVYISGGASGETRTYNRANFWNPPSGTLGNRISYLIGQDNSHNGTAIFNATVSDKIWLSGPSHINVVGDAGDGGMHFKLIGFSAGFSNIDQARVAYVDCSDGINQMGVVQTKNGIEFDHWSVNITDLAADRALSCTFTGSTWGDNSVHDITFLIPRITGTGADCIQTGGIGCDFYNLTITGYSASYTGGQHQDGIQFTGATSYFRFYGNVFISVGNYAIYGDALTDGFSHLRIYNNLCLNTSSSIAAQTPGGFIVGVDGGYSGTQPCPFVDVVIANNVTVDLGANGSSVALNNVAAGKTATFTDCVVSNNISLNSGGVNTTGNVTSVVSNNVSVSSANAPINFVSYTLYGGQINNLHLVGGATSIIGQGSDLSSYFTTDAAGLTRTVPWDIGAYKYLAASITANRLNVGTLNLQ